MNRKNKIMVMIYGLFLASCSSCKSNGVSRVEVKETQPEKDTEVENKRNTPDSKGDDSNIHASSASPDSASINPHNGTPQAEPPAPQAKPPAPQAKPPVVSKFSVPNDGSFVFLKDDIIKLISQNNGKVCVRIIRKQAQSYDTEFSVAQSGVVGIVRLGVLNNKTCHVQMQKVRNGNWGLNCGGYSVPDYIFYSNNEVKIK
jgi:hypothetical protein